MKAIVDNSVASTEAFLKVRTRDDMLDTVVQVLKEHDPFREFLKSRVAFIAERIAAAYTSTTQSAVISTVMEESVAGDRDNVPNEQPSKLSAAAQHQFKAELVLPDPRDSSSSSHKLLKISVSAMNTSLSSPQTSSTRTHPHRPEPNLCKAVV